MAKALARDSLVLELLSGAAGEDRPLPTEFRLLTAGVNPTTKGEANFTARSMKLVMKEFARRGRDRLAIDYDHGIHTSMVRPDPAESGKAAGWFKPAVRNGELWATEVEWNPPAAEKLKNREYRFHSPAIWREGTEVVGLAGVSLTNDPSLLGPSPLMASNAVPHPEQESKKMEQILVLLGLNADATETEAYAKVSAMLQSTAQLMTLTDKKDIGEALTVIAGWKAASAQLVTLSAQVETMKAQKAEDEIKALIGKAKAEGKVTPAMEPQLLAIGKADLTLLSNFIGTLQPVVVAKNTEPTTDPKKLPDAYKAVADMMGNNHAELEKLVAEQK